MAFLGGVGAQGLAFTVVGGCAVGAYAPLRGAELLTVDLDILATHPLLREVVDWAARQGAVVRKRPQPRNIPVAFLEWEGREDKVLASTPGRDTAGQPGRPPQPARLPGGARGGSVPPAGRQAL